MKGFLVFLALPHIVLGAIFIDPQPTQAIEARLIRPEGIAFSPSSECLAIADSDDNSVHLFMRSEQAERPFDEVADAVLAGHELMRYPHDVAFSSCGHFLAVACRNSNAILIFRREDGVFAPIPQTILVGEPTQLWYPTSVSFSQDDRFLAVANRLGLGKILLFEKDPDQDGSYGESPCYSFAADSSVGEAHGIAFAPDGHLAVVHKKFKGESNMHSALNFYALRRNVFLRKTWKLVNHTDYGVACLHSLSFHPSGEYLAVTHEKKDVLILKKDLQKEGWKEQFILPIDKMGKHEGPKGVAFSPCGRWLGVTTVAPRILIYAIHSVE